MPGSIAAPDSWCETPSRRSERGPSRQQQRGQRGESHTKLKQKRLQCDCEYSSLGAESFVLRVVAITVRDCIFDCVLDCIMMFDGVNATALEDRVQASSGRGGRGGASIARVLAPVLGHRAATHDDRYRGHARCRFMCRGKQERRWRACGAGQSLGRRWRRGGSGCGRRHGGLGLFLAKAAAATEDRTF